jgi:endonuclease-8
VVVQFDGPVLDLMTGLRARVDQRLAALGPDIIKDDFDERRYLRRLREDDPTRPIGDALLDQRTLAGIGNLWKVEACFATGISPWRPTGQVTDDEALALVRWARPGMRQSARGRHPDAVQEDLRHLRQAVPPLRDADRAARAVGRQPADILVPGCQT